MQPPIEKVVLLPRFTAFVGGDSGQLYVTTPINVKRYAQALIACQVDGFLGTTMPSPIITVQESVDLQYWANLGSSVPLDGEVTEHGFNYEWARLAIDVQPGEGFTSWCVADLVPRDT